MYIKNKSHFKHIYMQLGIRKVPGTIANGIKEYINNIVIVGYLTTTLSLL